MRIRLNPWLPEQLYYKLPKGSVLTKWAVSRLSTMLHEVCHAFLAVYACEKCPSFAAEVGNFAGHGSAWQRIAYAMELASYRTLGLKMSMSRYNSISTSWEFRTEVPTPEEVERWNLVNW